MNKAVGILVSAISVASLTHTLIAASLTEASKIYRGNFKDSPPSVQESGEYLFVIVEDDESKSVDGSLNELILTSQLELIEKYIGGAVSKVVSPFDAKVTEQLLPLVVFKIPDARRFPVERKRSGDRFRDVTAFELAPIKAAKEKAASGLPTKKKFDEWMTLLKEKIAACKTSEERMHFWESLGATTALLSTKGGVVCLGDGVDYALVEGAVRKWDASDHGVKAAEELIAVYPSCPLAWKALSESDSRDGDLLRAHIKALKANAAIGDQDELVDRTIESLAKENEGVWTEYGQLYRDVRLKADVLRAGASVHQYALRSFGRMTTNCALRNDEGAFKEAQRLFDRGEDLPRILSLLDKSTAKNPGNQLVWRYYGASLRAAGKMHDAVVAYHQALMLKPDDQIAAVDLCIAYQKLGMRKLAEGNAWCLVATSDSPAILGKARKIIMESRSEDFER